MFAKFKILENHSLKSTRKRRIDFERVSFVSALARLVK